MTRVVYALDFEGTVLAVQPVDPIAGWCGASDEMIRRTAAGVFIGLGLIAPEQMAAVQFSISTPDGLPLDGGADGQAS